MQTDVYANGREICSKAADGVSAAAFPDVCWSPPGPPAGPVPVPYPNTAFARDLANGTRTVLICHTMVAQKDKSYFSTSTGNEPATYAFAKGINTGALKGKAYFTAWSMNVFAEGLNVARHQDPMTHNHASPGGNTPATPFIDDPLKKDGPCAKEIKKVEDECSAEPEGDDTSKSIHRTRRNALKKLTDRLKNIKGKHKYEGNKDNGWMEHCDGLWLKPGTNYREQIEQFAGQLEKIKGDLTSAVADVVKPAIENLEKQLLEKVTREVAERTAKLGARAATRWGVGAAGAAVAGVGALVTETIATAWNIYDFATTAYEGYHLTKQTMAAMDEIKDVMDAFRQAQGALDSAWKEAKDNPQKAMAEAMSVFSRLNSCTRARRCILVPYRNTTSVRSMGGKGCCPGQTGHHVLPGEMTKDNCKEYNHGDAPTICVEGVTWSHGSHGMIHSALENSMENERANGRSSLDYSRARDLGVASVMRTFPESRCSKACLRAQLDNYYKNKCTGTLPTVSGSPKQKKTIEDGGPGMEE